MRTIVQRGVMVVATAHGSDLASLLRNPELNSLLGGLSSVIRGDELATRKGTAKTVVERAGPPTFDMVIEVISQDE